MDQQQQCNSNTGSSFYLSCGKKNAFRSPINVSLNICTHVSQFSLKSSIAPAAALLNRVSSSPCRYVPVSHSQATRHRNLSQSSRRIYTGIHHQANGGNITIHASRIPPAPGEARVRQHPGEALRANGQGGGDRERERVGEGIERRQRRQRRCGPMDGRRYRGGEPKI